MLKLERAAVDLNELGGLWGRRRAATLWWDNSAGVFVTGDARKPDVHLAGRRSLVKRSRDMVKRRLSRRATRRWEGPFDLGLLLPSATVLIPPAPSKEGVVAIDLGEARALKINIGRNEVETEVRNWELIKDAGIEQYVPFVYDSGKTARGAGWMFSEFVPNLHPFPNPFSYSRIPFVDRQKAWRSWLRWEGLPVLSRFYSTAGETPVCAVDMLATLKGRIAHSRLPAQFFAVAEIAETALGSCSTRRLTITTLHKDIIPSHVHRGRGRWWILDWGSSGRGLTCKEVFRNYFWTKSSDANHAAFWIWLRGGIPETSLPAQLSAEIALYGDWYSNWKGQGMDAEQLRGELLIALLQDYCEVAEAYQISDLAIEDNIQGLPQWARLLPVQLRALRVL